MSNKSSNSSSQTEHQHQSTDRGHGHAPAEHKHACCEHDHGPANAADRGHGHAHTEHKQACCEHDHGPADAADRGHGQAPAEHKHVCCEHDHGPAHQHGAACCSVPVAQTVTRSLLLEGMHCGDCAAKLEKAVSRMNGVVHAEVQFATAKMIVSYDEQRLGMDAIQKQIERLGYGINDRDERQRLQSVFRIEGMDCADCASKLEKRVGALAAVHKVTVNYGAAKMTVHHDGTADDEIMKTVRQAGYTAALDEEGAPRRTEERSFWRRNTKVVPTAISGAVFAAAWCLHAFGLIHDLTANLGYALAIVIGGYRIAKTGLFGLKSRTIGMDLLMTIAAIGAAVIGQWEEGAAVVFLFSLGETLEAYTMDRTRRSIRGLMDLSPKEALVRRDGVEAVLPIEHIRIGDTVIIKPGEKIAMDGTIAKGASTVNQAPITGESAPVDKGVGDEVFAGTINLYGSLEVAVTRLSKDNTLSRIVHMVEEAQAQKAPSQRFVDVFAKYYTPAVIILAVGIALIPPLFMNQPFDVWFYRALMMLVVSCPCALLISTPVSIVSAIGNAARNGVLVKGGAHLERLGSVSVIAFDKTGTLTTGVPQVTSVIPLGGRDERQLMSIAAAIEARSEHPVAEAIVRKAAADRVPAAEATDFAAVPGKGVRAFVHGTEFYIGSPRWFRQELQVPLNEAMHFIDRLESQGHTVMVLGTRDEAWAAIAVADEIRDNGRQTLERLRQIGIARSVMLTGDNQGTARAVASQLGGIEYRAELLPQDKVAAIRELNQSYGSLAMLGDGVNDAPALATATVGIAMGAAGTDTALETADVALMADDLSKLPYAIELSRRTIRIIKQNIAFSLLVKVVFLAMIFFGVSTLWMAVLADTGSSLIVIANGMRLLRAAAPKQAAFPGNGDTMQAAAK